MVYIMFWGPFILFGAAFLAICLWAFSRSRREQFENIARDILVDDPTHDASLKRAQLKQKDGFVKGDKA
jgi:cbb3-type cytochrome oxidase subunit 3